MLYLKLVPNEFENPSRDKRELSVARELGYRVLVIATTKQSQDFYDYHEGYDIYRISTKKLGNSSWLNWLNRLIAVFNYIIHTVSLRADIISGHDYIMLSIAYIANLFSFRKAQLIYDSHEFELGRNARRGKLALQWVKLIEGFLIRRVALTLMVGEMIADRVREIYRLPKRPIVIRNIPSFWQLDYEMVKKIRAQFLQELGMSNISWLLMYHGNIIQGEGFEKVICALPLLPDVGLIILGNEASPNMIEHLKSIAKEKGVSKRLLFKPAVPITELKNYIGAVDVEIIMTSDKVCPSYTYCLPNKFFESIQAGMPVICRNLPELERVVCEYDIGVLVPDDNEQSIANAVFRLRNDKELYERFKRNLERAKKELCWEKESLKLKAALQGIMGKNDREEGLNGLSKVARGKSKNGQSGQAGTFCG